MKENAHFTLLKNIKRLIQTFSSLATDFVSLARLESQLAKQSLIRILILALFASVFMFSVWLSILVLLFLFLTNLHFSAIFAASCIVLLNLLLLIVVATGILRLRKNLNFPATRRQLKWTVGEKS